MNLHTFIIDICSHSSDISCIEKSKKGRHIIESIISSNIHVDDLFELDKMDESTRTNLLYDLLHLKENANLAKNMVTNWDSREESYNSKHLSLQTVTKYNKELQALCDNEMYMALIIFLLSIELNNENYNENIESKYKELLKKRSLGVTKQWIDEEYYHSCENEDCDASN